MKDGTLSKAYLDTEIVLNLLLKDDIDIERNIRSVLTRKNHRTKYVVSLFVYGEVLKKLLEMDNHDQLMSELKRLLSMHKIELCGFQRDKFADFVKTCAAICSEDKMLDPMDVMIFSAAFIDEDANRVHFLEGKMLTSRVILNMTGRRNGFKICPINENSQETKVRRK